MKKSTSILLFILCIFLTASGQVKFGIRDEQGRHVIPRGFVVNTEDSKGDIFYTPDIIARPYPQCIAGDIMAFSFDYATRSLEMEILTDNEKGASRIFIPADRYYPDGFTITAGETQLILNPLKNLGLEVVRAGNGDNPAEFMWDPYRQQLVVLRWPQNHTITSFKLQPGLFQEILFRQKQ